jgi:chloride channel 3/4/5
MYTVKAMWRSFLCALVATFTLSVKSLPYDIGVVRSFMTSQLVNPFRTGKLVLFQVTYDRDWHFFEIIFFVILGIFGVQIVLYSPK